MSDVSDIHGKRLRHNRKRKIHSKTKLKTYSKTEKEKTWKPEKCIFKDR